MQCPLRSIGRTTLLHPKLRGVIGSNERGVEFLELIYGQLREAGIIRSKVEYSVRLLGKSPSYLTSMQARKLVISGELVMRLGDNLLAEIGELGLDSAHAEIRAVLRRAVASVNLYLADQTIPSEIFRRRKRHHRLRGQTSGHHGLGSSSVLLANY